MNLNGNSDIDHFAALNGVLYFSANDGIHGYELWRSNGTASGTYLVTDIRTGDTEVPNLNDLSDIAEIDNQIYFFALDQNSQPAIWKSNGTGATTLKVVDVPTLSRFAVSNNRMYFIAQPLPDIISGKVTVQRKILHNWQRWGLQTLVPMLRLMAFCTAASTGHTPGDRMEHLVVPL